MLFICPKRVTTDETPRLRPRCHPKVACVWLLHSVFRWLFQHVINYQNLFGALNRNWTGNRALWCVIVLPMLIALRVHSRVSRPSTPDVGQVVGMLGPGYCV
jgi:hypothetical protein